MIYIWGVSANTNRILIEFIGQSCKLKTQEMIYDKPNMFSIPADTQQLLFRMKGTDIFHHISHRSISWVMYVILWSGFLKNLPQIAHFQHIHHSQRQLNLQEHNIERVYQAPYSKSSKAKM